MYFYSISWDWAYHLFLSLMSETASCPNSNVQYWAETSGQAGPPLSTSCSWSQIYFDCRLSSCSFCDCSYYLSSRSLHSQNLAGLVQNCAVLPSKMPYLNSNHCTRWVPILATFYFQGSKTQLIFCLNYCLWMRWRVVLDNFPLI